MVVSPILTLEFPKTGEPTIRFDAWGLDPETARWLPIDSAEQFANDILRLVKRARDAIKA